MPGTPALPSTERPAPALPEPEIRPETEPEAAAAVLAVWFGAPADPWHGTHRRLWFEVDPAFDALVGRHCAALQADAAAGRLDGWAATPRGALALLILLDQVPRNLFRGTARAFATDPQARRIADAAIAAGHDRRLPPVERLFVYLPFEHAESLADQDRAVALFESLPAELPWRAESVRFAHRHREIIQRFGRFPHRNAALGRATTAAEARFLEEPESRF